MCGSNFVASETERFFPTRGVEFAWIFLFLLKSDGVGARNRSKMPTELSLEELGPGDSCGVNEVNEELEQTELSSSESSKL